MGCVSSPYETVLDVVLSCTTDSSFFVDHASSIYNAADAPFGLNETQYLVSMDATKTRRTVFAVLYDPTRQPQIAIRPAFNDAWILDWTYIPITTPPQQFDLPLTGATGTCKYSLDQFGVVRITGLITRDDGTTYFGTLPEGYRPAAQVVFAGCGFTDGSEIFPCTAGVDPDGRVWINDFGSGFTKVPVNMYFYL